MRQFASLGHDIRVFKHALNPRHLIVQSINESHKIISLVHALNPRHSIVEPVRVYVLDTCAIVNDESNDMINIAFPIW